MPLKEIFTENAPKPVGPYSQAIVHGGLVFVSGQLAIEPGTSEKKLGSIEDQTELVLRNLGAILSASGSSMDKVLKTTVYISDIALFSRANAVYAKAFGEHRPARAVVPTNALPFGFAIEIEAVAAIN